MVRWVANKQTRKKIKALLASNDNSLQFAVSTSGDFDNGYTDIHIDANSEVDIDRKENI